MEWPNHTDAWREWREAIKGQRLHHGWILAGKAGLGKHDFAWAAARELVREDGVPQPEGDHPDILLLTYLAKDEKEEKKREEGKPYETKRSISVAQIRQLQQRLTTRPTLGSRRVVIIHPADDMERNASNALLKSLEEPPQGTFFLLVTHRPARLLPTIRSRCRVLRFPKIEEHEIERLLNEQAPQASPHDRAAAIAAAGGSLGSALGFIQMDLGKVAQALRALIDGPDTNFDKRAKLTSAIGPRPDRNRVQAVLELARMLVAEQAAVAEPQQRAALIDSHVELVELAAQAPTYNFDTGLLVGEIGGLLARAAEASERANV